MLDYLTAFRADPRLPEQQAKELFLQLSQAINFAHERGIVHRDLKLENIILSSDRTRLKVADWGFAAYWDSNKQLSESCGSIHYAAPEICRGDSYRGPEVDVWSLGVVLYAFTTGRLPFSGKDHYQIFLTINTGNFRMPPYLTKDCQDLISACLSPRGADRPSVSDILRHRWLSDHPDAIVFRGQSPIKRGTGPPRRRMVGQAARPGPSKLRQSSGPEPPLDNTVSRSSQTAAQETTTTLAQIDTNDPADAAAVPQLSPRAPPIAYDVVEVGLPGVTRTRKSRSTSMDAGNYSVQGASTLKPKPRKTRTQSHNAEDELASVDRTNLQGQVFVDKTKLSADAIGSDDEREPVSPRKGVPKKTHKKTNKSSSRLEKSSSKRGSRIGKSSKKGSEEKSGERKSGSRIKKDSEGKSGERKNGSRIKKDSEGKSDKHKSGSRIKTKERKSSSRIEKKEQSKKNGSHAGDDPKPDVADTTQDTGEKRRKSGSRTSSKRGSHLKSSKEHSKEEHQPVASP